MATGLAILSHGHVSREGDERQGWWKGSFWELGTEDNARNDDICVFWTARSRHDTLPAGILNPCEARKSR